MAVIAYAQDKTQSVLRISQIDIKLVRRLLKP